MNRFVERMTVIDPAYGTQKHQRAFVYRYERRQKLAPCPLDHEHVDACYKTPERDGSFVSFGIGEL